VKLSPHYLKRYKDIAVLLMRYGEPSIRSRFSSGEEPRKSGAPDPEQLPKDLEKLGPTFVKLGQLLSSRPDLVPERYIKALSRLQDQVQPVPFEAVQEVVEAELGTGINKAFSEFEREPMAAASLGQVHRAALHDGRMVAVKVQRPGITTQIEQDFAALEEIASFAARHTAIGKKYQITRILEEFEKTIANELDYCREAANMIRIAENLKEFHHIQVPLPVQSYCSRRVLTMDYIDGTKITKLSPVVRLDFDGRMLAEELFRAYLKQYWWTEFFMLIRIRATSS